MGSPVKKFSAGAVQVAVWQNEGKEGKQFNTVSLDRIYKDKNDKWKSSNSLHVNELPKAILALQKAYEFLVMKETETGAENGMQSERVAVPAL